jgi:CRP/FNR family cyclic AMP-dependent transcriptional regulator
MTQHAVVAAISRCPLFTGLHEDDCTVLAAQCRPRRYNKGELVFARGDAGDCLYIVAQGSISLSASAEEGGEVVFAVLSPPQSFGELAIIDGGTRAASATARQRTVLIYVPGAAVRGVLREHPIIAMTMLKALAAMVRNVDDHAVDLVLVDLPGRVAKFLLAAAGQPDPSLHPGASVPVDLRLNQTELARLVGGSRQNVNRIIVSLEASGAIARRGARIVSVRPDLLVA